MPSITWQVNERWLTLRCSRSATAGCASLRRRLKSNVRRHAMAQHLCCGRRLLFRTRQSCINASPTRRTGGPDRHRRVGEVWIVESPSPNEDQMWSRLSLAKERGAAIGAEPAVHSIATVGHTRKVVRFSCDLERCGAKASADRSAARTQVLAIATPAHARGDWRFGAFPANRAAKTPTCHCHCALRGQERGFTSSRIVRLPFCWRIQPVDATH